MNVRTVLILVAAAVDLCGQAGTISGVVADDAGSPVAGARVRAVARSYDRTAEKAVPIVQFLPVPGKDSSTAKGEFVIAALQPGSYTLCAEKPGSGLLDPCIWSDKTDVVVVKAGATVSGASIQMERGAVITIQVADPNDHLRGAPEKDDIQVGTARARWPFIPARISGRDGAGKAFSLDVPAQQALSLTVRSANFLLSDDKDKPLAAGSDTIAVGGQGRAVDTKAGSGPPTVVIKVTAPSGGKK